MNPTKIHLSDVTKAAEGFLARYHPKLNLPIPIEEIVELKMSISIVPVPGIKNLLGIDAFINSGFTEIDVDEYSFNNFIERTRFSITHEIAHFILHKDWYKEVGPKDITGYLNFLDNADRKTYDYAERQANTFAGLVLVPTKPLTKEFLSYLNPNNKLPVVIDPTVYNIIIDLADKFAVSLDTLRIRLEREGLVNRP